MPQLIFPVTIDINLERFLSACSDVELLELSLLLDLELRIREKRQARREYKQEVRLNLRLKKQNP